MKPKLLSVFLIVPLLISLDCSATGDVKKNKSSKTELTEFQKIYQKTEFACKVTTLFGVKGEIASNAKTQTILNTFGSCFAVNFDNKIRIVTNGHLSLIEPELALNLINKNKDVKPALRWTKISSMTILDAFVIFKSTNGISLANAPEVINSLDANALITVEFEKIDYNADLAQLKPKNQKDYQKIKAGNFGDSDKLLIGEQVMTIGNPLQLIFVPHWGQIVHFRSQRIFTSEMVGLGNSGGPLLNQKGEIIGISKGTYLDNPHFGIFIPSNDIKDYLKKNK